MLNKLRTSSKKMKISNKRRIKLIDFVLNKNYTVVKAAKILQLKLCTARNIINKYKKQGIIYDKNIKKYVDPSTLTEYHLIGKHSQTQQDEERNRKQANLQRSKQDVNAKYGLQEKYRQQGQENLSLFKKEEVEFPVYYIYYNV